MGSQYGLAIWAYSYGRNRQEIIKGGLGLGAISILEFYW